MIENFDQHASNERTFLAWVRTTVAVEGFGIAGARVGTPLIGYSWADAVILIAGAVVVLLAWLRMRSVRRRIDSRHHADDEGGPADFLLAALVIAFFALLASFALRLSV